MMEFEYELFMTILLFWVEMACRLLVDASVSEKHTVSVFSVTTQKNNIVILNTVRTSNLKSEVGLFEFKDITSLTTPHRVSA
jgi:hypothetical protein